MFAAFEQRASHDDVLHCGSGQVLLNHIKMAGSVRHLTMWLGQPVEFSPILVWIVDYRTELWSLN